MGIIRKTASIATLGLVNFRSKAELLERARTDRDRTQSTLDKLAGRQADLKEQLDQSRKRAEKAELDLLAGERKRRRRRKAEDALDSAVDTGRRARRKAKKAARKAARSAEAQARDLVG